MRHPKLTSVLFTISLYLLIGLELGLAEQKKNEKNPVGTTFEDIGRGIKNAAQNVEKEIPKIGAAIGASVKKLTGNNNDKSDNKNPPKEKK